MRAFFMYFTMGGSFRILLSKTLDLSDISSFFVCVFAGELYSSGFDVVYNRHINHVIKANKEEELRRTFDNLIL